MRRAGLCLLLTGCGEPCHPDLHPAVIVEMPGRDCDAVRVLLGRPAAATLRCSDTYQDVDGCVAWCARAALSGAALVRMEAADETVDVAVNLSPDACPTAPDAHVHMPPPTARVSKVYQSDP